MSELSAVNRQSWPVGMVCPCLNDIHTDVAILAVYLERDPNVLLRARRSVNRDVDHAVQGALIGDRPSLVIDKKQGRGFVPRNVSHG